MTFLSAATKCWLVVCAGGSTRSPSSATELKSNEPQSNLRILWTQFIWNSRTSTWSEWKGFTLQPLWTSVFSRMQVKWVKEWYSINGRDTPQQLKRWIKCIRSSREKAFLAGRTEQLTKSICSVTISFHFWDLFCKPNFSYVYCNITKARLSMQGACPPYVYREITIADVSVFP